MGTSTKKALIFDPYLDTLGGGERYCLSVGECLLNNGWEVDLLWEGEEIIDKAEKRFDLKIDKIRIIKSYKRFQFYDLIFWLSDGSVPFLLGKKNFLHFQVPFVGIRGKNLINKVKFKFIDQVICNSYFTKKFINKEYSVRSTVLYPPVDVEKFKPGKKENIILAVGRFEETMQAKRQDILIRAFRSMIDNGLEDWQLVLIGGSLKGKNPFLARLKKMAKGYPIRFLINVSFATLKSYYQKAKIFWHAAGFGADETREPWRTEHFGITTVEAMAAGCVPVVVNKGGLKEIVRRGEGERWKNVNDLIRKTKRLIMNRKLFQNYQERAILRAQKFAKKSFCQELKTLL